MKDCFQYQNWTCHQVRISKQIDAILYIFFDLPLYFSKAELETFLGYAANNKNVTYALNNMVDNDMIVKKMDSKNTWRFYLGDIANRLLQRHEMPVIGKRTGIYSQSIEMRTRNGVDRITKRRTDCTSTKRAPVVSPSAQPAAKKIKLNSTSAEKGLDSRKSEGVCDPKNTSGSITSSTSEEIGPDSTKPEGVCDQKKSSSTSSITSSSSSSITSSTSSTSSGSSTSTSSGSSTSTSSGSSTSTSSGSSSDSDREDNEDNEEEKEGGDEDNKKVIDENDMQDSKNHPKSVDILGSVVGLTNDAS
jgi:hypothetical protein